MENDPDSEEADEATHPNGDYDTGGVISPLRIPIIDTGLLMVTCKSCHLFLSYKVKDQKGPGTLSVSVLTHC